MSPHVYPTNHSHLTETIARRVRHAAPASLLENHPGLMETVLCGLLLKQGFRNPSTIKQIAGDSLEKIQPRISRILDDTDSSVWYFSMLDSLDQLNPQSCVPAATTAATERKSPAGARSPNSHQYPASETLGALPPLPVCSESLEFSHRESMKPMPALR